MIQSARSALVVAAALLATAPALAAQTGEAQGYDALVSLFREWRAFQQPRVVDGVPDYTATAMAEQQRRLPEWRGRLAAIDTSGWPVEQRIDHRLVGAEMNGLDFDHRVLRPWARNPGFYAVIVPDQSDTPLKEGPAFAGALELWRYSFPAEGARLAELGNALRAIPAILDQARVNLVGDARDLWRTGILVQQAQSDALAQLAATLAIHHPELMPDAERARAAVDGFRGWLEQQLPGRSGPSGVGVANYDWYMRHVHLLPRTWDDEARLMERELARATAALKLEEHRNRGLPALVPISSETEWQQRGGAAVTDLMRFLREREVMTVTDYMEPALRARIGSFVPPEGRHFFAQVDVRDPRVLRAHASHWFDTARLELDPHSSPIRSARLLYNIWDSRSEGMATAMEELTTQAGLYADSPRSRELVYIMVAQRAARGLAGLLLHSRDLDLDGARRFAAQNTPRGWLQQDGPLNWFEQTLYMEQPGYGTSYLTGKLLFEELLAARARQLGDAFTLKGFMDEVIGAGMIPVPMIHWQLTGEDPLAPRVR